MILTEESCAAIRRAHKKPALFFVLDLLDTVESLRAQLTGDTPPRGFAVVLDEEACSRMQPFPNSRVTGHVVSDLLETIEHLRAQLRERRSVPACVAVVAGRR